MTNDTRKNSRKWIGVAVAAGLLIVIGVVWFLYHGITSNQPAINSAQTVVVAGDVISADMEIQNSRVPNSEAKISTMKATTGITEAKAKEIALKDAGVSEKSASFVRAELDREGSTLVYEIEFYSGNTEYDYDINATTGKVISVDKDIENYRIPSSKTKSSDANAAVAKITADKAKEIALKDAGVDEKDASFVRAKLDRDDSMLVYEIEFYSGNTEYDYDVDATTGEILSVDKDIEDYRIPSSKPKAGDVNATGKEITEDEAKAIALKHAGVSAKNASRVKVELDREGSARVYEVEFNSGRKEYNYDINAATGDIMSYESEYDD